MTDNILINCHHIYVALNEVFAKAGPLNSNLTLGHGSLETLENIFITHH